MPDEQNVPTQHNASKTIPEHVPGDEVVYTDRAKAKHTAIVQHLFSKGGKIVAHLTLKHNGNRLTDVEHDANDNPHTWHAKKAGA
ncbi:MAG: hypothetical protein AUF65_00485 [Chloroflexi bacterium 13_1_20CM_50_12]|nr:MAG: hypothetical protein AUF65_00485 [Chloroflexi bacterium 13_1_20CM_50_12]